LVIQTNNDVFFHQLIDGKWEPPVPLALKKPDQRKAGPMLFNLGEQQFYYVSYQRVIERDFICDGTVLLGMKYISDQYTELDSELVAVDNPSCVTLTTFWNDYARLPNAAPARYNEYNFNLKIILLPINYSGHWSVYLIIDPNKVIKHNESCYICHINSLSGYHFLDRDFAVIIGFLNDRFCAKSNYKFSQRNMIRKTDISSVRQHDGSSCALYTLCAISKCIDVWDQFDDEGGTMEKCFSAMKKDLVDAELVESLRTFILHKMEILCKAYYDSL
jgi:hypothetical protein